VSRAILEKEEKDQRKVHRRSLFPVKGQGCYLIGGPRNLLTKRPFRKSSEGGNPDFSCGDGNTGQKPVPLLGVAAPFKEKGGRKSRVPAHQNYEASRGTLNLSLKSDWECVRSMGTS